MPQHSCGSAFYWLPGRGCWLLGSLPSSALGSTSSPSSFVPQQGPVHWHRIGQSQGQGTCARAPRKQCIYWATQQGPTCHLPIYITCPMPGKTEMPGSICPPQLGYVHQPSSQWNTHRYTHIHTQRNTHTHTQRKLWNRVLRSLWRSVLTLQVFLWLRQYDIK